jgi:predicted kinase
MKTVIFLCGLIGAGKTTYAQKHFKPFTDLDYMPMYSKKTDQIRLTQNLLKTHDEVCHITCYPTEEEARAFRGYNKRFVLIDTGFRQAKTNVIIRNRQRDMMNLANVLESNLDLVKKYKNAKVKWEVVKVF